MRKKKYNKMRAKRRVAKGRRKKKRMFSYSPSRGGIRL